MSHKASDEYFREYIFDYCNECLWNEIKKPREEWDIDYICHYAHLKNYVALDENATVKSILDYMRDIESDDKILAHSRMVFKKFLKNMTAENCNDLLARMDEIINQKNIP